MAEAENKPSIRIHVDQQVTIEGVRGHEEVEDETVATEITGFDIEDDLYVLRGALSFAGFFRQEEAGDAPIPDAQDDRDVFDAGADVPEAPVLPFHHRLPFLLQVPVTAQEVHQRESGSLYVNPKIGQWNVHVLGENTLHLRAELILQGLSGQEGYVFRCGTQEEGVKPASSLDTLLDQEESRTLVPPAVAEDAEFEAPFDNAWASNYRQSLEEVEEPASEDDWLIESPAPDAQTAEAEYRDQEADDDDDDDDETEILFTPDPRLVFPMPEADSAWAQQLNAAEQAFPNGLPLQEQELFQQAQAMFEQAQREFPDLQEVNFAQASREVMEQYQVSSFEELQKSLFDQAQQSPYANQFLNPYASGGQHQAFEANQYREAYDRALEQFGELQPDYKVPSSSGTPSSSSAGASADAYHEAYNRIVASHGTPSPVDEDADAFVLEDTRVEEITELDDTFDAPEPFAAAEAPDDDAVRHEETVETAHAVRQEEKEETAETAGAEDSEATTEFHDAPSVEDEADQADADPAADYTEADEADRPILEAEETVVAHYEFEDEVPEQEIIAAAPEVVEQPTKPGGPKLSLGSKSTFSESGSGLKLSALLGESRAPAAPEDLTLAEVVEAAFAESAPLLQESLTGEASSTEQSMIAAPLYPSTTSKHDSVWGNFLRQKETKTTLKFRIVHETDSLQELAEQYNTTPSELQRANRLTRQEVEAGQILYIPTKRR
ncbi:LysM peptidoglycan-binding domain-containing protein [Tumebacillus flagellatus]|uniref:LysM domain-containing protein n=1 Tax=Tumebacillus flagellatus TaxID=1157490 RepID=A0A074LSG0_9BACL|nr:LysM peptidoglycan-binding domain-containing protein [Tumebacillus flagellatus]KEO82723.1 hypothetical protein EL26_14250 [Tumebacillus flagellatus]